MLNICTSRGERGGYGEVSSSRCGFCVVVALDGQLIYSLLIRNSPRSVKRRMGQSRQVNLDSTGFP